MQSPELTHYNPSFSMLDEYQAMFLKLRGTLLRRLRAKAADLRLRAGFAYITCTGSFTASTHAPVPRWQVKKTSSPTPFGPS